MPDYCWEAFQAEGITRLEKNRKGLLTQDELTRVSLVIGISKRSAFCSARNLRTSGSRGRTATQCSRTNLLLCS